MTFDLVAFQNEIFNDPIVADIWRTKYALPNEKTRQQTLDRVITAISGHEHPEIFQETREIIQNGYFCPAGRILAGAGTGRSVTMMNCYVSETVQDCMPGIQRAISRAALTMQQGGGIGTDYSTIRPAGAEVKRTGSVSSGIIPFADQQNAMCQTIMSAGTRRGAMMLTLRDDHPDLWNENQFEETTDFIGNKVLKQPSFISAKRQKGRLTNFNVSVLISNRFMEMVDCDGMWDLGFHVPRADGNHVEVYQKPFPYELMEIDNEGNEVSIGLKGVPMDWFVYRRVPARQIWDDIMRSTYTYAEPGVIFIDRVNEYNNLNYCEDLRTTNPCAEQPLPPFGVCCLGSINLAFMVKNPFQENASIDNSLFNRAVKVGVRFLDNVLDKTNYPLNSQREESMAKRRIGLGVTGFADMLLQLGISYGSTKSIQLADDLATKLNFISYETSMGLANEKGSFKAFNLEEFIKSKNLHPWILDSIQKCGIRNGVINTIAPNGTISLFLGNVSSGIEPIFSFKKSTRNVRNVDGSATPYEVVDYAQRLYEAMFPGIEVEFWGSAMQIRPAQHVEMLATWQKHIDSSISKTVNCPEEMSFDDFKSVYSYAYNMGCKGCTTYRENKESGRGSVLSEVKKEEPKAIESKEIIEPRPPVLEARTYKIRWPNGGSRKGYQNLYVTISRNEQNIPMEVFITTKEASHQEWVTALSRMITAVLRRGGPVKFLPYELMEVHAATGGAWIDKKYRASIVAAIGGIIEAEFKKLGLIEDDSIPPAVQERKEDEPIIEVEERRIENVCPACHAPTWVHEAGCASCKTCGHSNCE